jgi:hypothetical protein
VTGEPSRPTALDWSGVAVLCLCAALAGVLELLLVPLYAGSVIVPISVLGAVGSNIALPRLARTLVDSTVASVVPFLAWLGVVIVLGMVPRPEGDVILPGGGGAVEWVGYGVLLGGALAGTVTVVLSSNPT